MNGLPKHIRPCKSCRAPIFFAKTSVKGTPVPIDEKPEKKYVLHYEGTPADLFNESGHWVATLTEVWTTHFATCPDGPQHRKRP